MPTFDTPEPIHAVIDLPAADVRFLASDRADTVVEIRPKDGCDESDVQSAAQVQVGYSHGRLSVKAPRPSMVQSWFSWGGSIEVTVELPAGSRVDARTAGDFHSEGDLGDAKFDTADGHVRLDHTGRLQLNTSNGDIMVTRTTGQTDVTSANGEIRIEEIGGPAVIKTANGGITLGEAAGDLRLKTAYGDISVRRALGSVGASTATGDVRVGEVVRGSVVLETSSGEIEAGIRQGTAAYLDVKAEYGDVRIALDPHDGPGPADETVEIRARTAYGDILIRHS